LFPKTKYHSKGILLHFALLLSLGPPEFTTYEFIMEELIMSHMLELPDELYAALLEAADASGLTPIDWIAVHLLEAHGKKEIAVGPCSSRMLSTITR
jgi:hypothetical protein